MREQELSVQVQRGQQEIDILLEKDCLCYEQCRRMERRMEEMDLRIGALKAQVDHVAPMVVDQTEDKPEVREEEVEVVMPPPPVIQQALDTFGVGLLQAVAEWGMVKLMEVGSVRAATCP